MKFLWTLPLILPVCLLPKKVVSIDPVEPSEKTLADCIDCIGVLPEVYSCIINNVDTCDFTNCVGDPPDYEACGCAFCVLPWIGCLVGCIPDCLDTVVDEFIGCLREEENDCFNKCSDYQGAVDAIKIPILLPPKNCNLLTLLDDWRNCLPTFPACDTMQDTIIDTTCDATACCSVCHGEKLAIESCFYNWFSGHNCAFTCSERRSLTRETTRTLAGKSTEPEFVERCKLKLASDLLFDLDDAFNKYLECIMSNSMELAADESNKPTTERSYASGRLVVVFPILVATLMLDLMR